MPLENENLYPDAVRSDIRQCLVNLKANSCPMAVRLAWHASGTFNAKDGTGGSNGATMRFAPEISDDANAGLGIMRDIVAPVKAKHPELSYADLWTLSGCVAIEFLGGPKIPFAFGRTDARDGAGCPANGRLPDGHLGADHLRDVFHRMGFTDRDIVSLSGAHTLGRCHSVRSGFDGPWSRNPLRFDNSYFRNLMDMEWTLRDWDGEKQYQDKSGQLMMLETDLALKSDPKFKEVAQTYADNQTLFFKDFAHSFSKLIHLGCKNKPGQETDEEEPSAKQKASEEFLEQCMHGSLKRIQALKDKADVHYLEKTSGRSALHKAAFWGHVDTVKFLLDVCKVKPNLQDFNGDTALHDAARFGHEPIIKLLAPVTDKSLKNKEGRDVASVAALRSKL